MMFFNYFFELLNERYGICEVSPLLLGKEIGIVGGRKIEFDIADQHFTFMDLPSASDYEIYFKYYAKKIACAVLVTSFWDGGTREMKEQIALCEQNGIKIACIYLSNADCVEDEELMEIIITEACDFVSEAKSVKAAEAFSCQDICPYFYGNLLEAIGK